MKLISKPANSSSQNFANSNLLMQGILMYAMIDHGKQGYKTPMNASSP